ncbi:MAG TPA: phospholipase D-like domain-containing protein [Vicinamibacterales bacterium]|jgi:phosphatidylserine/phosphatidylglycerophosphate/cardiolipin synthase-like enzyme
MKLIVQPDAGIVPVVTAIKNARKSIDVLIFRLDRKEIARALEEAVVRGVHVRALTAHQNRGGTKSLRKLEMELLAGGVTVSRTADDLVRYHGKMMIIDGRVLHVYGFNFTRLDIEKSRSFGIITKNKKLLAAASKLFEADFERQPYTNGFERFIVSPDNARDRLANFIKAARKRLWVYDPKATDNAMLKLLVDRAKDGVDVKILGKIDSKFDKNGLKIEKFPGKRLHIRAIMRDGRRAFLGSQSLRKIELDKRREVGVVVTDETVVSAMEDVFMEDWARTDTGAKERKKEKKAEKKEERRLAKAS